MSKPKYKKGRLITSLDELVKQPVIWYQFGIGHKVLAKGWFLSFQVNFIYNQFLGKRIYTAELIEGGDCDEEKPVQGMPEQARCLLGQL